MTSEEIKAKEDETYLNWGVFLGYVIGGCLTGFFFWIAAVMSPREWWLDVAIIFFGYALGWNVGMLLSPKAAEKQAFVAYGKAITVFLGGFLIAKIDAALGPAGMKGVVESPVTITRFLIFGTEFLFGVQCTYVGRQYKLLLTRRPRAGAS